MRQRVAPMTMLLCLGFSISAMAGSPFNHLGRFLGWGWSDGYHVGTSNAYRYPENVPYAAQYGTMPDVQYPAAPYYGEPAFGWNERPNTAPSPNYPPNYSLDLPSYPQNPASVRLTSRPMIYHLPRVAEPSKTNSDYPSVSVP